jgi:predicted dehydrogenase
VTRFAIVGMGYWGPNYARVVSELPDASLSYAQDLNQGALAIVEQRWPWVTATTDLDQVLESDVDAVIVATPTSTHFEIVGRALEAGKHVLAEKPLALSRRECDLLGAAAKDAGRVLMVGHTFVFNPAVRLMREYVEQGALGRVLYSHATRTGLGPIRDDVNALWDLAPHDISMIFYLTGTEPISVSAHGAAYLKDGVEDVAFLDIELTEGMIANVRVSWLDAYKVRTLTLIGDEQMIVFDDLAPDWKLRVFDRGASYSATSAEARGAEFGEFKAIVRDGEIRIPKVPAQEPLKEQVAHFIECCQTGATPETDVRAARRVVAVLEAATESLRRGGSPVLLESPVERA